MELGIPIGHKFASNNRKTERRKLRGTEGTARKKSEMLPGVDLPSSIVINRNSNGIDFGLLADCDGW